MSIVWHRLTVQCVLLVIDVSKPAVSYPSYTPMLIRAQELWFHEPAVTTPVLKLFAELAQNRLDTAVFSHNTVLNKPDLLAYS